jgi:hypothetical protein
MTDELHVGDIGTILHFTVKEQGVAVDLSGATEMTLLLQKKDKSVVSRELVFHSTGSDGVLDYTTTTGDLDQAGKWNAQIYLELPSWQGHTSKVTLDIYQPLVVT